MQCLKQLSHPGVLCSCSWHAVCATWLAPSAANMSATMKVLCPFTLVVEVCLGPQFPSLKHPESHFVLLAGVARTIPEKKFPCCLAETVIWLLLLEPKSTFTGSTSTFSTSATRSWKRTFSNTKTSLLRCHTETPPGGSVRIGA